MTTVGELDELPAAPECLGLLRDGAAASGIAATVVDGTELLVERARAEDLDRVAAGLQLKRLRGDAGGQYVEYLGFDRPAGPLVRLRVHLQPAPLTAASPHAAPGTGTAGGSGPGGGSVPLSSGLAVAFVGCDGSGKSTVTDVVSRWLGAQLRVERIYLGSGQGSSSLLRWPLLLAHRLAAKLRRAPRAEPTRADGSRPDGIGTTAPPRRGLRRWLRPVWAMALAREKRQKLDKMVRLRAAGAVVVCDRYPQNEIMGFNDGPLLAQWQAHPRRLLRHLAERERAPYAWAQQHPPDLIVKLRVSREVALLRKPDMTAGEVMRRIAAIDALQFGAAKTLVVDADAPLEHVLQRVKAGIWEAIR
jgi:hypothetical protein